MLARIQVGIKPVFTDSFGEKIRKKIRGDLKIPVEAVRTIKVFTVEADISQEELQAAASGPFCDPVIQDYSLGPLALAWNLDFDWLIEVGFRPGVTDNEGRTSAQALELLIGRKLSRDEAVYTSCQYIFSGKISKDDAQTIARKGLANELIQRFTIVSKADFVKAGGLKPYAPKVVDKSEAKVAEIDLDVSDAGADAHQQGGGAGPHPGGDEADPRLSGPAGRRCPA